MRTSIILILCMMLVVFVALCVSAEEPLQAVDITDNTFFSGTGYEELGFLADKDVMIYQESGGNTSLVLENSDGMASLYLMFDLEYGAYTITDNQNGKSITGGTYDFLHEFIDLESGFGYLPTSLTLDFANGAVWLSEIYVFSSGETPDFVQKWEPPLDGKADILMMPTHGDDDQLYFAGLLPYYAGELDCAVQVAYLTNHRCDTPLRVHEMINGLWATGVENYPTFGFNLDFRAPGDAIDDTYRAYANIGISKEDLVGFAVEQFRRFKPQVVIGHDINGEYGHGMHKVYAQIIMEAVEISNDSASYPDLVQQYGLWDVPKTYLHLLEDNPIEINYDIPLEHFGGLTAFQVTQKYGFPCHVTQQRHQAFRIWLNGKDGEITQATQIETYSPCKFGLYRSTVGEDVAKNDFLENIITYDKQERLEQERLEQERLEKERLEQERLEQERLEQERLEQEGLELEMLEQAIAEAKLRQSITVITLTIACFIGFSVARRFSKKNRSKKDDLLNRKK